METTGIPTNSEPVKDYVRIAIEYAHKVKRDKRRKKYGKWVRLACIRFLKDLEQSKNNPKCDYYFDHWHANDVNDFIEKLPHVEGAWETPELKLEPWQIFNNVCIFGFRRKSDGHRRFNTVYVEVGRKNGKSAWVAGVLIYCAVCEGENGPQVYTAATTGKQARIVFNVIKKMIDKTPDLADAFNLQTMANAVVTHNNGGFIQPLNSKAETQDGLNPHAYALDELHAHKKRDLFDVLKSARGARKNPLSIYITTAGYNTLGVCYEQRKFVCNVLQNIIEGNHYYGIIYTIDEDDDIYDPACWGKANPNLNVSVQLHELRGYADEALISPESEVEFKTKRLNVWSNAGTPWVNINHWNKCDGQVDVEKLKSVACYAGLDLAATQDFNAWVKLWEFEGRLYAQPRFYLPEDIVKPRTQRGNVPFSKWADQGYIVLTPGNVVDYDYIEKDIRADLQNYDIQGIGYDPWRALQLTNKLIEEDAPLLEFRQGPKSFHPPMQDFERQLIAQTFSHGSNPILTWMASNLVARRDINENLAPDRNKSEEKIDGMVALLMAWGLWLAENETSNPYEDRGIVSV